jgi:hypothetical protein
MCTTEQMIFSDSFIFLQIVTIEITLFYFNPLQPPGLTLHTIVVNITR